MLFSLKHNVNFRREFLISCIEHYRRFPQNALRKSDFHFAEKSSNRYRKGIDGVKFQKPHVSSLNQLFELKVSDSFWEEKLSIHSTLATVIVNMFLR